MVHLEAGAMLLVYLLRPWQEQGDKHKSDAALT